MINWRDGTSGLVNGLKYFIKGVFKYSYTATTATVVPTALPSLPTVTIVFNALSVAIEKSALDAIEVTIDQDMGVSIVRDSPEIIVVV